jgi:hypothetical protein
MPSQAPLCALRAHAIAQLDALGAENDRMPRSPRTRQIIAAGFLVHLISRFVDGRFLFDDEARIEYRRRLGLVLPQTDWRLISFALMSTHIHLGLISGTMLLWQWLQCVHVGMAQWLNARRRAAGLKTLGQVFGDRPSTRVHPLSVAGPVVVYQHRNPDRAGVVEDPLESSWTSHRCYVGVEEAPAWLEVELGLGLMGYRGDAADRAAFHDLARSSHVTKQLIDDLPRVCTAPVEMPLASPPRLLRADAGAVVSAAASVVGIHPNLARTSSRTPEAVRARRFAILVWRELGGTQLEMARELGMTPQAASKLVRDGATSDDVGRVLARLAG